MAAISSAADGTWIAGAATTWVGGVAPAEGDTATILNTHDVEIDGDITVGADSATAAIQVNSGGSLFVPSTVAGNYTLTLKGDLKTDGTGGTISFGTSANPIPNTRTFTVKTNYSASLADGKYGLIIAAGGTFNCQGADPWGNGLTDPDRCLLATDEAVNSTEWTVNGTTLWLDNDKIGIASTSTSGGQSEIGALNGAAAGTTLTVDGFGGVGGGLAYAHSGTSPTQAEIINLTRNVKITAYDISYAGFLTLYSTSVSDVDWTEISYLGENAANKKGVHIQTTTGSCNFNRCSFYNGEDFGIFIEGSANNFTLTNCVGYNMHSVDVNPGGCLTVSATTNTNWTINNFWMIKGVRYGFYLLSYKGTFTNNRVAGTITGFFGGTSPVESLGTFSDILCHSNQYPFWLYRATGTISNMTAYHNNSGASISNCPKIYVDGLTIFGNTTVNLFIGGSTVIIDDLVSNGSTTQATTNGIMFQYTGGNVTLNNADFSTVGGIKTAHTTDIAAGSSTYYYNYVNMRLYNSKLGGTTPVTLAYGTHGSYVISHNHGQVAGTHKAWFCDDAGGGITFTLEKDASYYNTAAPSIKITPASASYKQAGSTMQIPVASGANPTVSVYFRKSAAYNGNQPRLIVKRNDALGITADTVMATSAAAVDVDTPPGTFTQLSGQPGAVSADGVLEVYVDCDGTAGYINICDWAVTGAKTQADNLDAFYLWGLPFDGLLSASAAGGNAGFPPDPMSYGRG